MTTKIGDSSDVQPSAPEPPAATRPMTGAEYLESLRDGREVWFRGERVEDVTAHPAFRNSARSVARLYDALHDEGTRQDLTIATDTGSGGFTHATFRAPYSTDDLIKQRDAIAGWSRLTYGWLGRSPDYKAGFTSVLGPAAEYYGDFADNARAWYRKAQEQNLYINHSIVNPPVDRNRDIHEVEDIFVHVVNERDDGIVVRGAKMVATGSALTNTTAMFYYGSAPIKDPDYALAFFVPTNARGVKLLSRPSYEYAASKVSTPFDQPLSSRFDENDAVLILEDVFIPWEDVLVYRDPERMATMLSTGYGQNFSLQGCTRLAVKLDFLAGCFLKAVDSTGSSAFRGVQASLGEVIGWRDLFWGLTDAMTSNPTPAHGGTVLPNAHTTLVYRIAAQTMLPRIKDIISTQVAGALIVQPSAQDLLDPGMRGYIDTYYRGSNGYDAEHKVKLVKLLWDAIGSEFGGRHDLYERNYFGNHEQIRLDLLNVSRMDGTTKQLESFVEQCMGEYDLNGWRAPDLISGEQ
ncbi:4-hydroxyphenylacetate 3-hydroxylase N-terminal domain-containing protein [Streptomyces umbrinus]|uniref:4-hydroxyphenylacetate 3-hydroxylase N-terminal domain-containing protein n=1 Tax=Streptomyces umbrinus TaxID=67370 RepID=UPI0033EA9457